MPYKAPTFKLCFCVAVLGLRQAIRQAEAKNAAAAAASDVQSEAAVDSHSGGNGGSTLSAAAEAGDKVVEPATKAAAKGDGK